MRKRLLVITLAAAALGLGVAGPAAANKNVALVEGECSNGESKLFRVNLHAGERSGENAATPIVGGGSFKATELHLFLEGAEIALRFILSHPAVSTTIAGMRKPEHVRQNIAASDAGPLDDRAWRYAAGKGLCR